jgi:diguanylate cyclase (GGDEF)-like protein
MADRLEDLRRQLMGSLQESFEGVRPEGDEMVEIGRLFDRLRSLRRSIEIALGNGPPDGRPRSSHLPLATDLHLYLDQLLQRRIEEQVEELKRRAECDPLTGLRHRAAFETRVRNEISSTRQTTRPFLLVLFDLDRFKSVNDRYGHPAGDQLLIETGDLLRSSLAESDEAFRIGGDEFAVLCRDLAPSIGERMAREIDGQLQVRAGGRGWVEAGRLSWGIAVYPDDLLQLGGISSPPPEEQRPWQSGADGEVEALIRLADQYLYECKASRQPTASPVTPEDRLP